MLHVEAFSIEGHAVSVSPFVLPFPSRLKPGELDRAGGREALKTGHGFYVYRGGRLVVPGGWFRIVPADELARLARVRVDVPVALDHIWKVDIRKTTAEPPPALRPTCGALSVTLRPGAGRSTPTRAPPGTRGACRSGGGTTGETERHRGWQTGSIRRSRR